MTSYDQDLFHAMFSGKLAQVDQIILTKGQCLQESNDKMSVHFKTTLHPDGTSMFCWIS